SRAACDRARSTSPDARTCAWTRLPFREATETFARGGSPLPCRPAPEETMHPRPTSSGLLAAVCALSVAANAAAGVKGRAHGLYANLPSYGISNLTQCDTGWLDPITGGSRSSYKNGVSYGATLHVDHMESESHGDRCMGHSGSSLDAGYIMKGMPSEVTWLH